MLVNDLFFDITPEDSGFCVTISYEVLQRHVYCESLACVADMLVNIEKVLDLLNFNESEVLPNE